MGQRQRSSCGFHVSQPLLVFGDSSFDVLRTGGLDQVGEAGEVDLLAPAWRSSGRAFAFGSLLLMCGYSLVLGLETLW